MIHFINIILIIIVSIIFYFTLFKKEGFSTGFRINQLKEIPHQTSYKPIEHLPTDIIAWISKQIGAPNDPHSPDYIMDDTEEQCLV